MTAKTNLAPLRRAAAKATESSVARDDAIRKYHADGVSLRIIAEAVGLSFQRVHQIVHEEEK